MYSWLGFSTFCICASGLYLYIKIDDVSWSVHLSSNHPFTCPSITSFTLLKKKKMWSQESTSSFIRSIWRRTMTTCPSQRTKIFWFRWPDWLAPCYPPVSKRGFLGISALSSDSYLISPWVTRDLTSHSQVRQHHQIHDWMNGYARYIVLFERLLSMMQRGGWDRLESRSCPVYFPCKCVYNHLRWCLANLQNMTWSLVRIRVFRLSADVQDSDFKSATHLPFLVSTVTDLRETARSPVSVEAGECGATHCPDV